MATSYPDCKDTDSFQSGLEFQDFVLDKLIEKLGIALSNYSSRKYQFRYGENRQGVEIKLDRRILETGNVSIEIAEKSRAAMREYTPSGIYRVDNTWLYIQGNREILFIFAKNELQRLHASGKFREYTLPTIKKFHLPLAAAFESAALTLDFREFDDEFTL
jgi:hypothetical protein